jgi:hypothetical protein
VVLKVVVGAVSNRDRDPERCYFVYTRFTQADSVFKTESALPGIRSRLETAPTAWALRAPEADLRLNYPPEISPA